MNKHGFTLVELLAAFVIIAAISGIAVVSYSGIVRSANQRVYSSYEDTIHAEMVYHLSNEPWLPQNNTTERVELTSLDMDPIKNPDDPNDLCLNSYIDVTRNDVNGVISFTYKVCLICNKYNSDGNNCRMYEN